MEFLMKRSIYYSCLLFIATVLSPLTAHADNFQTSVRCTYHHTLGDDAIMMYGKPGRAMWHDFFGNTSTDAFSTAISLSQHPETTCSDLADSSAYWAPSLMLPNGVIQRPSFQKTYYQTVNSTTYPLTAFPVRLQLLAGDHKGTQPNPHISFYCENGWDSTSANQVCGLDEAGDAILMKIGIRFPNCWDGVTLKAKGSKANAVYADDSGQCPADYPAHLPTINMNVAYYIYGLTSLDISKVQLSLDPIMNGDQRIDQWGSIYTAHADFMNGWTPEAAEFMVDRCMNNNYDCTSYMPYSYTNALADTYVSNLGDSDKNFGSSQQLLIQGDISNSKEDSSPEKVTLLKLSIPPMATGYSPTETALFKYNLHLYGGQSTGPSGRMIYVYPTSTDWDENSVTWNTRPTCDYKNYLQFYIDSATSYYHDVDITNIIHQAQSQGKTEVAFCIGGDTSGEGNTYTFYAKETNYLPQLMVVGVLAN
jgi:hypothetical protein